MIFLVRHVEIYKSIYFFYLTKFFSNFRRRLFCDCGLSSGFRNDLIKMTKEIQTRTEELINSGVYDTSDNFTVVAQPFMKNMGVPKKVFGLVNFVK